MLESVNWAVAGAAVAAAGLGWAAWRRGWLSETRLRARSVSGVEAPIWVLGGLMMLLAPVVGASLAARLPEGMVGAKESLKQIAVVQVAGYGFAVAMGVAVVVLIRRAAGAARAAAPLELRCTTCSYPLKGLKHAEGAIHCPECGASYTLEQRAAMKAQQLASNNKANTGLTIGLFDLPRGVVGLLLVAPFYVVVSEGATWIERAVSGERAELIKHTMLKKLDAAFRGDAADERAWAWVVVASVVVLVPMVEELMYRGFLQSFVLRVLEGRGGEHDESPRPASTRWLAVVLTSVIFALMHVATGVVPWSAAAALFALSIGLGIAFERTGRIGVPIVMHGLFNAVNVGAVVLGWN